MEVSKEQLEALYRSVENRYLCQMLGVSNATLIAHLKKHGIALKGKGNRKRKSPLVVKTDEKK